jgi:DNA-binding LacI/PurR family transcriptional regulator
MNYLISNGYKRIAYIGGASPNISVADSLRTICYRETLRKNKIPYDENIILDCNWDLNLCAEYTKMLLRLENRPDAIFAGSDTLASVILGVIYQMGLTCPKDVGVVGFNNLDSSGHTIPPLTTVDIPTKDIGKIAAIRLLELINNEDDLTLKINLPTKLIVRNSTRNVL